MQSYTYSYEIRDTLTQFLQAFDGAIVKRYNNQRIANNVVGVRYVYAPKQRVLHDLINKAQHITLPAVSFWISGISRDVSRVFNKLQGDYPDLTDNSLVAQPLQPVPVNIEISVSILTRFQTDMDQILSNFVPYNDPYFIISWTRWGTPNIEIRSEVLWSGNLALTYPIEQQPIQPTRVICDTSFTIKGWLFKKQSDAVGKIFKIDNNFYAVSATPTFDNLDVITSPGYTESFVISGAPQVPYASRVMTPVSLSASVDLFGDMLSYTNYVYLSANSNMFGIEMTVDPFSASPSVKTSYPALSGVNVPLQYTLSSDNKMSVYYPAPSAMGNFEIIVVNDAGYSSSPVISVII